MDEYIKKTIAAYNASPQKYAEKTQSLTPHPEIEEFLSDISKNGTILDAGCANGRDTQFFVDQGFKVVGIDLSEELIKIAKRTISDAEFRLMDLRKLEFSDNYFDGIWCNATLHHLNIEDSKKALNEFCRVLKPRGKLFISVKEGQGSEDLLETFSSDNSRFYMYQTIESLEGLLLGAKLNPIKTHVINEKEKFGKDTRDLNWVNSYSMK